jgi:hypothetical protein
VKPRLAVAECLSCGAEFRPRRRGHVFCSNYCRHRGEKRPEERIALDSEQVRRLFDPDRDPKARVRDDDWHPTPDSPMHDLDAVDTVADRRRWYLWLLRERP